MEFNQLHKIQQNMASRLNQEHRMNQSLELLAIIQDIVPDKFGRIQKELVIIEAIQRGMQEQEVIVLLEDLIRTRSITDQGDYISL